MTYSEDDIDLFDYKYITPQEKHEAYSTLSDTERDLLDEYRKLKTESLNSEGKIRCSGINKGTGDRCKRTKSVSNEYKVLKEGWFCKEHKYQKGDLLLQKALKYQHGEK